MENLVGKTFKRRVFGYEVKVTSIEGDLLEFKGTKDPYPPEWIEVEKFLNLFEPI